MDISKALIVYEKKDGIGKRFLSFYKRCCDDATLIFKKHFKDLLVFISIFALFYFIGTCLSCRFSHESALFLISADFICPYSVILIVVCLSGFTVFGKFISIVYTSLFSLLLGIFVQATAFSVFSRDTYFIIGCICIFTFLMILHSVYVYCHSSKAFMYGRGVATLKSTSIYLISSVVLAILNLQSLKLLLIFL